MAVSCTRRGEQRWRPDTGDGRVTQPPHRVANDFAVGDPSRQINLDTALCRRCVVSGVRLKRSRGWFRAEHRVNAPGYALRLQHRHHRERAPLAASETASHQRPARAAWNSHVA